jgi:hypothetical protein
MNKEFREEERPANPASFKECGLCTALKEQEKGVYMLSTSQGDFEQRAG